MKLPVCVLPAIGAVIVLTGGCSEATAPTPPQQVPPDGYQVHLADRSGEDLLRLGRGLRPEWSPDGNTLAFERSGDGGTFIGIFIIDTDGTNGRQITGEDTWGARWSPDGRRIVFARGFPNGENGSFPMYDVFISVINADGSDERRLAGTGFPGLPGTIHSAPEWSPDGRKIAFTSGEDETRADLHVMNEDGREMTRLTQLGTVRTAPAWSPDGGRLALGAAGSVYSINADGSDLTELTRAPDGLVVRSVVYSPSGDRIAYSLSPDPLVQETEDPASLQIHVVNADGTSPTFIASDAVDPRWLADGRSLSFGRGFGDEIWTVSADGGVPVMLLPDGIGAAWSPDGTRVAYVRDH